MLVSKQLLEKQGGGTKIESKLGKWITVHLELPVIEFVTTTDHESQLAEVKRD